METINEVCPSNEELVVPKKPGKTICTTTSCVVNSLSSCACHGHIN